MSTCKDIGGRERERERDTESKQKINWRIWLNDRFIKTLFYMNTLTTFSIGALQIGQTGVVLWFLISKAQGMQVCKCPQGTKSAFLGLLGSKQIEQDRSSGSCCFGISEIFDESSLTAESCFCCCCCSNCFCCSCFCTPGFSLRLERRMRRKFLGVFNNSRV